MNTPKQEHTRNLSIKRRTLIKGTASTVPVVLTLRSGAAFAADSAGACVARTQDFLANNPGSSPTVLVEQQDISGDNWVRRITTGRVIKLIEKNGKTVNGKNFVIFRDPTFADGALDAKWFKTKYNTTHTNYFVDQLENGQPNGKMQNKAGTKVFSIQSEAADCHVLAHVDRDGTLLETYGEHGVGDFPFATTSCMASITG